MAEMQTVFPVYLPKRMDADDTEEEYDTGVARNENLLNQNFSMLYNRIAELTDTVEWLTRDMGL